MMSRLKMRMTSRRMPMTFRTAKNDSMELGWDSRQRGTFSNTNLCRRGLKSRRTCARDFKSRLLSGGDFFRGARTRPGIGVDDFRKRCVRLHRVRAHHALDRPPDRWETAAPVE